MTELTKTVSVLRFGRGGDPRPVDDTIIRECPLSLWLNGTLVEETTCVPDYLEELALGHLLTEGVISSLDEITSVRVEEAAGRVLITGAPQKRLAFPHLSPAHCRAGEIMSVAGRFLERSALFEATGMVHSALVRLGVAEYFAQCIGRHNAINKAVGLAMKAGADFSRSVLYTSGRLPLSMAMKAVRAGIPLVVSRSGPTDATLELAGRTGLTVVGFARGERMNLYTPL